MFRAGFVAVMGRPNVGKSTLINTMLGAKIAAVSPWPQTTRKRQAGILTLDDAQIVLIDTPGIHQPLHKLGEHMNEEAAKVLEESDLPMFVVDASVPPNEEDRLLAELVAGTSHRVPGVLVLNKSDLIDQEALEGRRAAYQDLLPQYEPMAVSATQGTNIQELIEKISQQLPKNPPFYPEDQLTDIYERDIAADLIREAALHHLRAEVPHSIAVRIDEYREKNDQGAYIEATLFVERESQKGIVIGQGGTMMKKIGTYARKEIEQMSGRKIFLRLRVKVRKNWRDDENTLKLLGYQN